MLAKNAGSYQQELMAAIARLHDGHAAYGVRCRCDRRLVNVSCPLSPLLVENQPVVIATSSSDTGDAALQIGDVITNWRNSR